MENIENKDMFKKYKESLTNYYISNEILIKLKIDLVDIENKYNFIENQLNNLIDEKKKWTTKDEYMTTFLNENGFEKPKELEKFIIKYKNHKCLIVEENDKYKEMVMKLDILKYGEKERLRVEKENENLRYDIDIGMKKRDKEINELKDKILLLEKYNKQDLNDNLNINNYINTENKIEKTIENSLNDINISSIQIDNNNITILENVNINEDIKVKKTKKGPYLNKDNSYMCPVIKYKEIENEKSEYKIKAAKETMSEIIHYHGLYKTLNKEGKNIDEIVQYIIENRKIDINSGTNKQTYRNKIIRSYNIYEKYNDELKKVYFSLTKMAKIYNKDNWDKWLKTLDNCIYDKENDDNIEIENEKKSDDIINFNDVTKVLNKDIIKNIECINKYCQDNSDNANKFCNDCQKDLIKCNICKKVFWTDENNKYCEECNESIEMEGAYSDDDI